jgi:Icc-related predicted phosphoesterase
MSGIEELRKVIDNFEEALVVCGHLHEVYGVGRIGETVCVNA